MKINFEGFQDFDQQFIQRELKPCLHEASINYHLVSSGRGTLFSPPALTIDISRKYLPLIASFCPCLIVDFPKTTWLGLKGRSLTSSFSLSTSKLSLSLEPSDVPLTSHVQSSLLWFSP
jgi:hypothetical protein